MSLSCDFNVSRDGMFFTCYVMYTNKGRTTLKGITTKLSANIKLHVTSVKINNLIKFGYLCSVDPKHGVSAAFH